MDEIRWDPQGLVPAIVQDAHSGQVLMLAYMNAQALERTAETGEAWFWSRSRQELWHKGATSGNRQRVLELRYDCDGDALLLRVDPLGPACHTGQRSCLYQSLWGGDQEKTAGVLERLWGVIQDRQAHPQDDSYTCRLLRDGLPKILKKVGEEAIEVIVAAQGEGDERLLSELADLVYHVLVLLAAQQLHWDGVKAELARRFGK
jgi:phosphoribosyl-ATP pyrophosphohydrolase/phosphoribosyl-AMP cyclohydrolase